MGIQNFGAPRAEITFLQSNHSIDFFIETGTFRGETTQWAASRFKKVITIEGSIEIHRETSSNLKGISNIEFLCGDSRTKLPEALTRIGSHQNALFWLDAHWMPGSFGETAECPLLEEIELILEHGNGHIILIDDARLFLAPPPLPHKAGDWPTIDQVMELLHRKGNHGRYSVVFHDVIFSVPQSLRTSIEPYFQRLVTDEMNSVEPLPLSKKILKKLLGR